MLTASAVTFPCPSGVSVRRSSDRLSSCCLPRRRAWQTLNSKQQAPWLLLSSPDEPESRYLYDLTAASASKKGDTFIRFNRELHLPEIAGHHLISSSQGFLLSVDDNVDLQATDPLTGATLRLPPTATLPNVSGVIRDPLSGDITGYVFCNGNKDYPEPPKVESFLFESRNGWTKSILCLPTHLNTTLDQTQWEAVPKRFMGGRYYRAVLSPSLDTAAVIHHADHGYVAFACLGEHSSFSSWTALPSPEDNFHDLIFHGGRLHAIDMFGTLTIFDLDNPLAPPPFRSPHAPMHNGSVTRMSMVESPDGKDLFLVERKGTYIDDALPRTLTFNVFKLDNSNYKWNPVGNVGDIALFLGTNHSFSLSTHDFLALRPNRIYFTDDISHSYNHLHVGDTGVYHLEDDSFQYFELSDGPRNLHWPAPIWFMPSCNREGLN